MAEGTGRNRPTDTLTLDSGARTDVSRHRRKDLKMSTRRGRHALAALGLLPAAFSHAIGSETQRPIAVVVVGGTISAALLTAIFLPVSYYWLHRAGRRVRERWRPA